MSVTVDLDGTLAKYDRWRGPDNIGEPTPLINWVKQLVDMGVEVKILTARVSNGDPDGGKPHIQKWLKDNGLPELEITAEKDYSVQVLVDDRAVRVLHNNTGRLCNNCNQYIQVLGLPKVNGY